MDKPKELAGLAPDKYDYPLADVSHLSEKENKDLLKRGMRIIKCRFHCNTCLVYSSMRFGILKFE